MYAVFRTGGKQYRAAPGDVVTVERLAGAAGQDITLNEVLLVGDAAGSTVGAPLVEGAVVKATVLEQARGEKIIVFKKKRRKNYRRTMGHRQNLTVLRVTGIEHGATRPLARTAAKPAAATDATDAADTAGAAETTGATGTAE